MTATMSEYFRPNDVFPVAAVVSGSIAGSILVFNKIRPYFKVKVNCWFCNTNSKVPYSQKNSFTCQSCQQYNGFNQDGSYNKDISALSYSSLNPTFKTKRGKNNKDVPTGGSLCKSCNLQQTIKVQSLANFVPYSEDNYDAEIEVYRQNLEKTYKLCRDCQVKLHQEIGRQNSWLKPQLITWRLHQSKAEMLKAASQIYKQPLTWRIITAVLILLSITLCLVSCAKLNLFPREFIKSTPEVALAYNFISNNFELASIVGLVLLFIMLFGRGKDGVMVADIMCCLSWICLITFTSCRKYFSKSSYTMIELGLNVGAFIVTLWMSSTPRVKKPLKKKIVLDRSYESAYDCSHSNSVAESLGEDQELSISSPSPIIEDKTSKTSNLTSPVEVITNNIPQSGLDSFRGLKIGTPRKSPSEVSARSLFSERPSKILADPKFTSKVTQASWVAGGYWGSKESPQKVPGSQSGITGRSSPHNLNASRTSSQSSGFVSRESANPFAFDDKASATSDGPFGSWPSQPSHKRFGAASACGLPYTSERSASPAHSCDSMLSNPYLASQSLMHEEIRKMYGTGAPVAPRWSPWVAFFFGVSVTANIFLAVWLSKT